MRSILLQTRRTSSRSLLLLPRLSSSSSPLPRRCNASLPSSVPPSIPTPSEGSSSSPPPSLLQPSSNSSSSSPNPWTSRDPPPPLRVPSSSSSPTGPAFSRSKGAPKSFWLSQRQVDNHRAKTRALAERLEGEGSEGVVGTPDVVKTARNIFKATGNLPHIADDHLRSICIIYHAISTSPTAENDYGREWIRSTLVRLLLLFTRRSNPKSEVLVSSLQLLVQAASKQEDLEIRKDDFRTIAVDLASGATNASEAVEIVEGLRSLSPSSFTESEFEEVLQAIGRVEDWTTTTRNTFQLPSFPTSIEPLYQPPLSTSAGPSKTPATPKPPKPKSPRPPSTISPSASPSPAEESETSLTPSPPPPSPKDLLEFSRTLSAVPSPSVKDLRLLIDLYHQVYLDNPPSDPTQIETVLRFLAFANRAPSQDSNNQYHFLGIVSSLVKLVDNSILFDFTSFDLDFKTDLLPLVNRLDTRGRVRALVQTFYAMRTEDYRADELEVIREALVSLPEDASGGRSAASTFIDWEKGFEARLSDLIQSSASSSNNDAEDRRWLDRASAALEDSRLGMGRAYGLLERGALDAPSTLETLVVASKLYSKFAPPSRLPLVWRQHGDALVRILLLFSNHRGETPPFHLLSPALLNLHHLPPFFIPSTPSIPSFAIPLLPISTTLKESLLVVDALLRAQQVEPAVLPSVWSSFLSSLEKHSAVPSPTHILSSDFFHFISNSSVSSEVGSPLEDLIRMYLRRWTRVEKEGGNLKAEEKALETLEQFVDGQRRGAKKEYGVSLFATLLEVQGVVRKDWKGVIKTWEEVKGEAGLNEKAVEMYLLACLETSSFDRARTLFATIRSNPPMLPLLTSKNWSLSYSLLVKAKDLPSLVEGVAFQASSKHEDASPLAVEDLVKGIQLAREVGGEEGKTAEGKLVDLVGKERFEEAVGRSG